MIHCQYFATIVLLRATRVLVIGLTLEEMFELYFQLFDKNHLLNADLASLVEWILNENQF